MKILLLADPGSYHTIKWAEALVEKGMEISIFGLSGYNAEIYKRSGINIYSEGLNNSIFQMKDGSISKSIYLRALPKLKQLIKELNPDLIHAHYASSYGLLGALINFHPFFVSVWGSDVYDFPKQSFFHKMLFKFNLGRADIILSSSNVMADEVRAYTAKKINIIPFGIDIEKFKPLQVNSIFSTDNIVIGTIKPLEKQYGIEFLLRAFYELKNEMKNYHLKLLLIGKGTEENTLKQIACDLDIQDETIFTGYIPNNEVHCYINMMDVAVFPSLKESFGVSALEVNACAKPVIVSDAPGFTETVEQGVNGLFIKRNDISSIVSALKKIIMNPDLGKEIGERGRNIVLQKYNLKDNLESMLKIYQNYSNQYPA